MDTCSEVCGFLCLICGLFPVLISFESCEIAFFFPYCITLGVYLLFLFLGIPKYFLVIFLRYHIVVIVRWVKIVVLLDSTVAPPTSRWRACRSF